MANLEGGGAGHTGVDNGAKAQAGSRQGSQRAARRAMLASTGGEEGHPACHPPLRVDPNFPTQQRAASTMMR